MFETLFIFFIGSTAAVSCHDRFSGGMARRDIGTCEGDVCGIFTTMNGGSLSPLFTEQFCVTGIEVAEGCSMNMELKVQCFCKQDFCNELNITITPDVSLQPIITCWHEKIAELVETSSNVCTYLEHSTCSWEGTECYRKVVRAVEQDHGLGHENIFDTTGGSRLFYQTLYLDACYNYSSGVVDSWSVFCRCAENLCNMNIPYPVSSGDVKCHTTEVIGRPPPVFLSDDQHSNKTCLGKFCVLLVVYPAISGNISYSKGCLNVNEGENYRLQPGLIRFRETEVYLCDTAYCNRDINSSMESARLFWDQNINVSYGSYPKDTSEDITCVSVFVVSVIFGLLQ